MDDNKDDEFSRTAMWKKSIAADNKRDASWMRKSFLVLGTIASIFTAVILFYIMSR